MKQEKTITELIIDLQAVNARLEKIRNDDYIKQEAEKIFGNRPKKDHTAEIRAILDAFI